MVAYLSTYDYESPLSNYSAEEKLTKDITLFIKETRNTNKKIDELDRTLLHFMRELEIIKSRLNNLENDK